MQNRLGVLSLLVLTVVLVHAPLAAQRTTFNPSIGLFYTNTDNVGYVTPEAVDDFGFLLNVVLPVEREMRRSRVTFSYSPYFQRFDKVDELDNIGHFLNFSWSFTPSQKSELQVALSASRTQAQGQADRLDSVDSFLDARTDRDVGYAYLNYRRTLGGRWSLSLETGGTVARFDEIEDLPDPENPPAIENRSSFYGLAEIYKSLSSTMDTGLQYRWESFELDLSQDETVQSVSIFGRKTISQQVRLTLSGGVYDRKVKTTRPVDLESDSSTGFQGRLDLTKNFRSMDFLMEAAIYPSLGGARIGTSTDGMFGLGLVSTHSRKFGWGLYGRYAKRRPNIELDEDRDSISAAVNLEYALARHFSLVADINYINQSATVDQPDSSVYRAIFGARWYPLGWTRMGGRQGTRSRAASGQ